jgi:uncharacterized phage protein (TIGR02218 family)
MIALLPQPHIAADLYTLTLLDGTVYRFTSYDLDLVHGGNLFVSTGLLFVRGRIRRAIGFKVDSMTLDVHSSAAQLMQGLPFLEFAHNGGLDGAGLLLERAAMPVDAPTDTSAGVIYGFEGSIQVNELTRDTCRMEVRSDMDLLNVMMPRTVYQPSCGHALFDAGCGLSKAAFEVAGTVSLNSASQRVVATNLTQPSGYFNGGTLRFVSGENAGALATVLAYAGGVFTLMRPLIGEILAGDAVVACPGCPRTVAACSGVFANLANFGGQPHVPSPETAL